MRVGLISHSGRVRDAIGNQLAEKFAFFQESGADVRVFLQTLAGLHPQLVGHAAEVAQVEARGPVWDFLTSADLVVLDYSQFYNLLDYLPLLAGGRPRLVIDYHGVTPPDLWTGSNREMLYRGMSQRGLVWCADAAIVHSCYMADELHRATRFPRERITQLGLVVERYSDSKPRSALRGVGKTRDDCQIVLFVGRVAGNKRVPILIEALAKLRTNGLTLQAVIAGDHGDVYAEEYQRCLDDAESRGLADHVHFLGPVADGDLAAWYRSASVLVQPSVHEGFCLPVLEAMAHGLPVIAARATALPETVADAGLTFVPDDSDDLARQIQRILSEPEEQAMSSPAAGARRVAIVSFRFGADIVGGAERSLRTMAQTLQNGGHHVEVFATCARGESDWANDVPPGTVREGGLVIHRFPIDPHNRSLHLETVRRIVEADGRVDPNLEAAYLEHSIHSSALIDALRRRQTDFDALVVGPYLFGLTWDVANAFPGKTLLLPCFHDEPLARLSSWPRAYGAVGGVLYHSPEEQHYAQSVLGVNHPRGLEVGTLLKCEQVSPRVRQAGSLPYEHQKTLVYCGRFSAQKNLPRLLEFAERYEAFRPGRYQWVFMGEGETPFPLVPWLVNLGRVDEQRKRDMISKAAALVQLSRNESLSLVVLEAWAEGVPVIVDQGCAVLAGQVNRSQGGQAIDRFDEFASALDDLWTNPAAWSERGQSGRTYVQEHYASEEAFLTRIREAIDALKCPLAESMRRRGLQRAKLFTRSAWRSAFGQFVESVMDAAPRPFHEDIELEPYQQHYEAAVETRRMLVPLRVRNRGSHAACADGPGRTLLCWGVIDSKSTSPSRSDIESAVLALDATPLPGLLVPGQTQAAAISLAVPRQPGNYHVSLWAAREGFPAKCAMTSFDIQVTAQGSIALSGMVDPLLDLARAALAEAERLKRLPDDFVDVTIGRFASWKRWLKQKMLGNFKRAYVDVISRQQSQVNQRLVTTVQQLAECCATLDHAMRGLQERLAKMECNSKSSPATRGSQAAAESQTSS